MTYANNEATGKPVHICAVSPEGLLSCSQALGRDKTPVGPSNIKCIYIYSTENWYIVHNKIMYLL